MKWVLVSLAGTWFMIGGVWNVLHRPWFALASGVIGAWFLAVAIVRWE